MIDRVKQAVRESAAFSTNGEFAKALKVLDDALAEAVNQNNPHWVRILSHHAAAICDYMGNLDLAASYYKLSLAHAPDNPMALYGLADVLFKQGETQDARQYALRCYVSSVRLGGRESRAFAELLAKRWPELGPSETAGQGEE
jgi:Tfp pilus assembly protein PilF